MQIQLNTDNHIIAHEKFRQTMMDIIAADLHRFSEHITRIEVHLADENANKNTPNDKRCTLEARVEGHQPIATTAHGDSVEQALSVALSKLTAALTHLFDRIKSH